MRRIFRIDFWFVGAHLSQAGRYACPLHLGRKVAVCAEVRPFNDRTARCNGFAKFYPIQNNGLLNCWPFSYLGVA